MRPSQSVISRIVNAIAGGGGDAEIDWVNATEALFTSLTALYDPNSLMTAPITIGANGLIIVHGDEPTVAYDGLGEGAIVPMEWPEGWLGKGQVLMYKLTFPSRPGVTSTPMAGLCFIDKEGNPLTSGALGVGAGAALVGSTGIGVSTCSLTTGSDIGNVTLSTNDPSVMCAFFPGGVVGDADNVGSPGGFVGIIDMMLRSSPGVTVYTAPAAGTAGPVNGGFVPGLYLTFDGIGFSGAFDWPFRLQYALIDITPADEFTP